MAFCRKCGVPLDPGTKFCRSCGATVEAAVASGGQAAAPGELGDAFWRSRPPVSFKDRVTALAIDVAFLYALHYLIVTFFGIRAFNSLNPAYNATWLTRLVPMATVLWLPGFLLVLYHFTEVAFGWTPGKRLMRLTVRSKDGARATPGQLLRRWMLKVGILGFATLAEPFLVLLQRFHRPQWGLGSFSPASALVYLPTLLLLLLSLRRLLSGGQRAEWDVLAGTTVMRGPTAEEIAVRPELSERFDIKQFLQAFGSELKGVLKGICTDANGKFSPQRLGSFLFRSLTRRFMVFGIVAIATSLFHYLAIVLSEGPPSVYNGASRLPWLLPIFEYKDRNGNVLAHGSVLGYTWSSLLYMAVSFVISYAIARNKRGGAGMSMAALARIGASTLTGWVLGSVVGFFAMGGASHLFGNDMGPAEANGNPAGNATSNPVNLLGNSAGPAAGAGTGASAGTEAGSSAQPPPSESSGQPRQESSAASAAPQDSAAASPAAQDSPAESPAASPAPSETPEDMAFVMPGDLPPLGSQRASGGASGSSAAGSPSGGSDVSGSPSAESPSDSSDLSSWSSDASPSGSSDLSSWSSDASSSGSSDLSSESSDASPSGSSELSPSPSSESPSASSDASSSDDSLSSSGLPSDSSLGSSGDASESSGAGSSESSHAPRLEAQGLDVVMTITGPAGVGPYGQEYEVQFTLKFNFLNETHEAVAISGEASFGKTWSDIGGPEASTHHQTMSANMHLGQPVSITVCVRPRYNSKLPESCSTWSDKVHDTTPKPKALRLTYVTVADTTLETGVYYPAGTLITRQFVVDAGYINEGASKASIQCGYLYRNDWKVVSTTDIWQESGVEHFPAVVDDVMPDAPISFRVCIWNKETPPDCHNATAAGKVPITPSGSPVPSPSAPPAPSPSGDGSGSGAPGGSPPASPGGPSLTSPRGSSLGSPGAPTSPAPSGLPSDSTSRFPSASPSGLPSGAPSGLPSGASTPSPGSPGATPPTSPTPSSPGAPSGLPSAASPGASSHGPGVEEPPEKKSEPKSCDECGTEIHYLDGKLNAAITELQKLIDLRTQKRLAKLQWEIQASALRTRVQHYRAMAKDVDIKAADATKDFVLGLGFWTPISMLLAEAGVMAATVAAWGIRAWRLELMLEKVVNYWKGYDTGYGFRIPYKDLPKVRNWIKLALEYADSVADSIDEFAKWLYRELDERTAAVEDGRRKVDEWYRLREETYQHCLETGNLPPGTWHRPPPEYTFDDEGAIIAVGY